MGGAPRRLPKGDLVRIPHGPVSRLRSKKGKDAPLFTKFYHGLLAIQSFHVNSVSEIWLLFLVITRIIFHKVILKDVHKNIVARIEYDS